MKKEKDMAAKIVTKDLTAELSRAQKRAASFQLSVCSKDYLKVFTDPFGDFANLPCIPDDLDYPSQKWRSYRRGVTAMVGTQSIGFVAINPFLFGVSDIDCMYWTGTTYNQAGLVQPGFVGVTGLYSGLNNSAYVASTQLGPALKSEIQFRLVGCALRVRYTGTELNKGGKIILARAPGLDSVMDLGPSSITTDLDLLQIKDTVQLPCTRSWKTIAWFPGDKLDFDYIEDPRSKYLTSDYTNGYAQLVALFTGTPGNSYDFEVMSYFEYRGSVAAPTKSHSDIVGLSAVRDHVSTNMVDPNAGKASYDSSVKQIESSFNFESVISGVKAAVDTAGTIGEMLSVLL